MADMSSTRRGMLGAMALAPVAISIPAVAMAATTPTYFNRVIDAADAAALRFNRLPVDLECDNPGAYAAESNRMLEASRRGDAAVPGDWKEFARWVEHITDQGASTISEKNADRLLNHVRRLIA